MGTFLCCQTTGVQEPPVRAVASNGGIIESDRAGVRSDYVGDARPEDMSAVRTEDFATASVRVDRRSAAVVSAPAVEASASEGNQFEHDEPGRILAVTSS